MSPLPRAALLAALLAAGLAGPGQAQSADPTRDYTPGEPPAGTTWYVLADPAAQAADRRYVEGMRPHHEGAITMSEEYLKDPEARSPTLRRLAQAIIANQRFEIALLEDVARQIAAPARVLDVGFLRLALQPVAMEGLGPAWHFQKWPIPGPVDLLAGPPPTERDVQFAKGMAIHHQAAVEMARDYDADPKAKNGFLKWLNIGIITDQMQEIALMQAVIRRYPGDPEQVRVDPSMIHGMEGHGGAAAAGHADPPPHHHH